MKGYMKRAQVREIRSAALEASKVPHKLAFWSEAYKGLAAAADRVDAMLARTAVPLPESCKAGSCTE